MRRLSIIVITFLFVSVISILSLHAAVVKNTVKPKLIAKPLALPGKVFITPPKIIVEPATQDPASTPVGQPADNGQSVVIDDEGPAVVQNHPGNGDMVAVLPPASIIADGDMEENGATKWCAYGQNIIWGKVGDIVHGGIRSVRIDGSAQNSGIQQLHIPVVAGKEYEFSISCYFEKKGLLKFWLGNNDSNSDFENKGSLCTANEGEWGTAKRVFTAPQTADFRLVIHVENGGIVRIDDIFIAEYNPEPALVEEREMSVLRALWEDMDSRPTPLPAGCQSFVQRLRVLPSGSDDRRVVDADEPFKTVQAAIDASGACTLIQVAPGEYRESIGIMGSNGKRQIVVEGEDRERSIINGGTEIKEWTLIEENTCGTSKPCSIWKTSRPISTRNGLSIDNIFWDRRAVVGIGSRAVEYWDRIKSVAGKTNATVDEIKSAEGSLNAWFNSYPSPRSPLCPAASFRTCLEFVRSGIIMKSNVGLYRPIPWDGVDASFFNFKNTDGSYDIYVAFYKPDVDPNLGGVETVKMDGNGGTFRIADANGIIIRNLTLVNAAKNITVYRNSDDVIIEGNRIMGGEKVIYILSEGFNNGIPDRAIVRMNYITPNLAANTDPGQDTDVFLIFKYSFEDVMGVQMGKAGSDIRIHHNYFPNGMNGIQDAASKGGSADPFEDNYHLRLRVDHNILKNMTDDCLEPTGAAINARWDHNLLIGCDHGLRVKMLSNPPECLPWPSDVTLKDGDMEGRDETGVWGAYPSSMPPRAWGKSTVDKSGGLYGLAFESERGKNSGVMQQQIYTPAAGDYRLQLKAKVTRGAMKIRVMDNDTEKGSKIISASSAAIAGWKDVSVDFNAPRTRYLRIFISGDNTKAAIDDVRIIPIRINRVAVPLLTPTGSCESALTSYSPIGKGPLTIDHNVFSNPDHFTADQPPHRQVLNMYMYSGTEAKVNIHHNTFLGWVGFERGANNASLGSPNTFIVNNLFSDRYFALNSPPGAAPSSKKKQIFFDGNWIGGVLDRRVSAVNSFGNSEGVSPPEKLYNMGANNIDLRNDAGRRFWGVFLPAGVLRDIEESFCVAPGEIGANAGLELSQQFNITYQELDGTRQAKSVPAMVGALPGVKYIGAFAPGDMRCQGMQWLREEIAN